MGNFSQWYWKNQTWHLAIMLTIFLLLHSSSILSHIWTNFGLLELVNMQTIPLHQAKLVANRAESLLQKAVLYDPQNRFAWRGLGFALAVQQRETDALLAWKTAEVTIEDIIGWGEWARGAKRYIEALAWYERATLFNSKMGDPQYYIGLTYEDMVQWQDALSAYEQAINTPAFSALGRSTLYYRIGMIYHRKVDPFQLEDALNAYETALTINDFDAVHELADAHYLRGEILRWQEADPEEYINEYKQAVLLNPKHALARVWLGTSYYNYYENVEIAEFEIQQLLDFDARYILGYIHLGDIYRQEERIDEALAMYKQALVIDPESEAAHQRLRWMKQE